MSAPKKLIEQRDGLIEDNRGLMRELAAVTRERDALKRLLRDVRNCFPEALKVSPDIFYGTSNMGCPSQLLAGVDELLAALQPGDGT